MLPILVFLPIAAFIAILLGSPARFTAIAASVANLALGIWAAATWQNECWNFSLPVLEKPALNLAFGMPDGMSAQLAGSLAAEMHAAGGQRIDEVLEGVKLSDLLTDEELVDAFHYFSNRDAVMAHGVLIHIANRREEEEGHGKGKAKTSA